MIIRIVRPHTDGNPPGESIFDPRFTSIDVMLAAGFQSLAEGMGLVDVTVRVVARNDIEVGDLVQIQEAGEWWVGLVAAIKPIAERAANGAVATKLDLTVKRRYDEFN